jgi:hypothetical protein
MRVKRRREERDWPPAPRRRPADVFEEEAPPPRTDRSLPPKTDWASSPITTKIANAYFGSPFRWVDQIVIQKRRGYVAVSV